MQNNLNYQISSATNWVCSLSYEFTCSYSQSLLQLNLTLFLLYQNLSMTYMSIRGDFPDWLLLSHHLGISYKSYDSERGKKYLKKKSTLCVMLFKARKKSGNKKPCPTPTHTLRKDRKKPQLKYLYLLKGKTNWVYCLDAVGQTEEVLTFSSPKGMVPATRWASCLLAEFHHLSTITAHHRSAPSTYWWCCWEAGAKRLPPTSCF